ncbi:MAG: zinc ribbon domain-containing protein [Pseudomonadota bacterium]
MADQTSSTTGKVPLKAFLSDFKSGIPDHELKDKYSLTAKGFVSIIKALLDKKVIGKEDLATRKRIVEQREAAKESAFLQALFLCPHCGHPHPTKFPVCPACGFTPDDSLPPEEVLVSLTTHHGHFHVQEELEVEDDEDIDDGEMEDEGSREESAPPPIPPPDEESPAKKKSLFARLTDRFTK